MNEFINTMYQIFIDNRENFIRGAGMTLLIALTGTIVGVIIGLFVGIVRTIPTPKNKVMRIVVGFIKWLLSAYISIFRGTPMIVQAMVIFFGTAILWDWNITPLTASLLIVSVNTGAYMSEVIRGGILSVDEGQYEAAQAIGMSHWQIMQNVVMPQAFRNVLPSIGNEFVINIKDTSVLNVISMNELYFTTNTIAGQNYRYFETFFVTAVIYYILTFIVTQLLQLLERHLAGDSSYALIGGNQVQVTVPKESGE
jgi:putative lysine transport system permease protein